MPALLYTRLAVLRACARSKSSSSQPHERQDVRSVLLAHNILLSLKEQTTLHTHMSTQPACSSRTTEVTKWHVSHHWILWSFIWLLWPSLTATHFCSLEKRRSVRALLHARNFDGPTNSFERSLAGPRSAQPLHIWIDTSMCV